MCVTRALSIPRANLSKLNVHKVQLGYDGNVHCVKRVIAKCNVLSGCNVRSRCYTSCEEERDSCGMDLSY